MKRIAVATLFGLVAGVICATVASSGRLVTLTTATLVWILLNRAIMGFVIGASALKIHWAWNGILMGVVVGSIFSYYLFMSLHDWKMLALMPIGNAVFGLMIEFFTSFVFKQRAFPMAQPILPAAAA